MKLLLGLDTVSILTIPLSVSSIDTSMLWYPSIQSIEVFKSIEALKILKVLQHPKHWHYQKY